MSCLSPPLPEVLHLLLLAQWWLQDEVKTYVLKFSNRLTITFQTASHECTLAERYSLLIHCAASKAHLKKNSFKQEGYNDWISYLRPAFAFTPRFLIRFETSMLQWHPKKNSLKRGTIVEFITCEVISFLPKSPDTLCDLNMAMAPGKNKELHYHISFN